MLAEGSWKDVPHGSPQRLVLGAGASATLDYASFPDAQSDLTWSFERAPDSPEGDLGGTFTYNGTSGPSITIPKDAADKTFSVQLTASGGHYRIAATQRVLVGDPAQGISSIEDKVKMVDAYAVKMEFYRDAECTKVLDEWPEDASKSQLRSPKHIFGQRDPIYVSVTGLPTDQLDITHAGSYSISFTSPSSAGECIRKVPLVKTGESAAKTGVPVFLGDRVATQLLIGTNKFLRTVKIVDEEDLLARLVYTTDNNQETLILEKGVMVDRGEYVAVGGNEIIVSFRSAARDFNIGLQTLAGRMNTQYQWMQNGYQEGKRYFSKEEGLDDGNHSTKAVELLHNACDITAGKSPADSVCYAGHAGGRLSVLNYKEAAIHPWDWGVSNSAAYWDDNSPNFALWNRDVEFLAITAGEVLGTNENPESTVTNWKDIFETKIHAVLGTSAEIYATESDEWSDFLVYASGHGSMGPCTVINAWKYAFLTGIDEPYGILVRKANLDDYLLTPISSQNNTHVLTADVTTGPLLYFWYQMRAGSNWADLDPVDAANHSYKKQPMRDDMRSCVNAPSALVICDEAQDLREWRNAKEALRLKRGFACWDAKLSSQENQKPQISDDRAISIAEEFISANGGMPLDAKITKIGSIFVSAFDKNGDRIAEKIPQEITIVYGHDFFGIPVQDDAIRITISKDGRVVHYLRKWGIANAQTTFPKRAPNDSGNTENRNLVYIRKKCDYYANGKWELIAVPANR